MCALLIREGSADGFTGRGVMADGKGEDLPGLVHHPSPQNT